MASGVQTTSVTCAQGVIVPLLSPFLVREPCNIFCPWSLDVSAQQAKHRTGSNLPPHRSCVLHRTVFG